VVTPTPDVSSGSGFEGGSLLQERRDTAQRARTEAVALQRQGLLTEAIAKYRESGRERP